MSQNEKIDFGFREVPKQEKEPLVKAVFDSVASKYDIMNDLMSFGLHRLWKKELQMALEPCKDLSLIDVASGTLDIAKSFLQNGGSSVDAVDINKSMLDQGKKKLINQGFISDNLRTTCANAELLPFTDDSFDLYTISFGIRNVTNKDKALTEAYRVLKFGGKFICLEFSKINDPNIKKLYEFYSFQVIPKIGKMITRDAESYQYLVESIQQFPNAQEFSNLMAEAGFDNITYKKLTFGIVALHIGYKI